MIKCFLKHIGNCKQNIVAEHAPVGFVQGAETINIHHCKTGAGGFGVPADKVSDIIIKIASVKEPCKGIGDSALLGFVAPLYNLR